MESCPDGSISISYILTLAIEELCPLSHLQAHTGPWVNTKPWDSLTSFPHAVISLNPAGSPRPGKLLWLFPLERALPTPPASNLSITQGGQVMEEEALSLA